MSSDAGSRLGPGILTFKYRLYPTVAQAAELESQLAEACRLFNGCLQERRDAWRMCGKRIGFYAQKLQLKDIRAAGDLAIPSYKVAADVIRRVDGAFEAFFRRVKTGEKPGYPRFRSWRRYDSLTFSGRLHWLTGSRVSLHGVGDVKLTLHRPLEGRVKTVTVKRRAGRWFVTFACEVARAPLQATGAAVGVDVGLASFATLSTGEAIPNPRYLERAQRRVRLAQRRVSRRVKGSRGRRKAVRLLQRAHERVENQRRDFHHKVSHDLVKRFDLIAVEDLNVKGLARTTLARPIHDAGWAQFLRYLAYKAENAGRSLVAVDPAGTSQQCSGCGQRVQKSLAQRWHSCPCGVELDRDVNASLNILRAGMARAALTQADVRPHVAAGAER